MRFRHAFRGPRPSIQRSTRSRPSWFRRQARIEHLEDRRMLANIQWTNRGNDDFEFFETDLGVEAEVAREVVDAAIDTWERTITGFNGMEFEMDVEIFLDTTDPGTYAQASSGTVRIANSTDPSTPSWFIDETPFEHSEFQGTQVNPFARQPQASSPAFDKVDLYTVVVHEIGHLMGISSGSSLLYENPAVNMTSTTISNDASGQSGDVFWVFEGPTTNVLMTDFDIGGTTMEAGHFARPRPNNAPVQEGSTTVYGSVDIMNGTTSLNPVPRFLLSNKTAMVLDDVGYDVILPERFGTMNTILNESTGVLTIEGGIDVIVIDGAVQGASDDIIQIDRLGSELIVSVNFGVDVPGTGPGTNPLDQQGSLESRFNIDEVSEIVVTSGNGNDQISVQDLPEGIELSIFSGIGDDIVAIGGLTLDNIDENIDVHGQGGTDTLRVFNFFGTSGEYEFHHDELVIDDSISVFYDGVEEFEWEGAGGADSFTVRGISANQDLQVNGNGGDDEFVIRMSRGFATFLSGDVHVIGGADTDTLLVKDGTYFPQSAYTVSSESVARDTAPPIFYEEIEQLELRGGRSSNDYHIESTLAETTVTAWNLADEFFLGTQDLDGLNGPVTINAGKDHGGDDVVYMDDTAGTNFAYTIINNLIAGSNFSTIDLNNVEQAELIASGLNNIIFMENSPGKTRYSLDGSAGDDTFFLASTSQNLNGFNNPLIVHGGDDENTLILSDQAAPFNLAYHVQENSIDRLFFGETGFFPTNIGVTFSDMDQVELNLNSKNNTVNVQSTSPETTYRLYGHGGDDTLRLFRKNDSQVDPFVSIAGNSISSSAMNIQYFQFEDLELELGDELNTVELEDTVSDIALRLGGADDRVRISPDSAQLGTIDHAIEVDGEADADRLELFDFALSNNYHYTVTSNSVDRFFFGPLFGSAPGVTYEDVSFVRLFAGAGENHFNIDSMAADTQYFFDAGPGDDIFDVTGLPASPVTLFGATGNDHAELTGTPGDDVISVSTDTGLAAINLPNVETANLNALGGSDELVYEGTLGLSEDVRIAASAVAHAGNLIRPSVLNLAFEDTEIVSLNGNKGDGDQLTFLGTAQIDRFFINLAAAGTIDDPLLTHAISNQSAPLLSLRDAVDFSLAVHGRSAADIFNVHVSPDGPARDVLIDGGPADGDGDVLNVIFEGSPNVETADALINITYDDLLDFSIFFTDIESLKIGGPA